MKEVAGHREDQEFVRVLSAASPRRVQFRLELTGLASTDDSPDGWLYELASDFILTLTPRESPLILLKDAMYSIANNIFLRNYPLWPLYAASSPRSEPFAESASERACSISVFRSVTSALSWFFF